MFLNNRYQDPTTGIFLSVDPLIAKTGQPYLYAAGNPTTLSDPNGLEPGCGATQTSATSCRVAHATANGIAEVNQVVADYESTAFDNVLRGGLDFELNDVDSNYEGVYNADVDDYFRLRHREQLKAILAAMLVTDMEYFYSAEYMQLTIDQLGGYQGDRAFRAQFDRAVRQSTGAFLAAAGAIGVFAAWGANSRVPSLKDVRPADRALPDFNGVSAKIQKQMGQRGWTEELIEEAWATGAGIPTTNLLGGMNTPALRYVSPTTGQSVVIDVQSGQIIQVGGPGFVW